MEMILVLCLVTKGGTYKECQPIDRYTDPVACIEATKTVEEQAARDGFFAKAWCEGLS